MANNNIAGAKAFGGILVIFAVIAGVYAMVEPMNQRIDFLERQVEFNREETAKISALTEKFAKVETQFKGLGALHATEQRRDEARLTKVEGKVENIFCWREEWMLMALPADAQQTRRLDNLERVVFKEDK